MTATVRRPADREPTHGRSVILARVSKDARLTGTYVLLVVLSAAIATLGLLQSSTAVVIGAMLVSPLLGPIMGAGFGVATLDSGLIRRSLLTLGAGMAAAVLVAVLIIFLSPVQDVTPELRARTQPTLLDLGVAVVGGIAGVYAILRKLSGVMVGVAIATALVPPLCTVGFGLVTGRFDFALGAGLLFLTNTLAITFAATAVARLHRFGPSLTPQHSLMQIAGILATLGVLSIPLALSLNDIVAEVRARGAVQRQLDDLLSGADRIDTLTVRRDDGTVSVEGIVLVDRYDPTLNERLRQRTAAVLDRPVDVGLVQLRQESDAADQLEDRLNRRIAALENRDAQASALLEELTVGGLIDREHILLDVQARRVVIERDRAAEAEPVAAAVDRVIATAQARHATWLIRQAALIAEPEARDETGAAPSTDTP